MQNIDKWKINGTFFRKESNLLNFEVMDEVGSLFVALYLLVE